MPNFNDFFVLLPELYLVVVACLLLLLDAFMKPQQRIWLHWLSIAALLLGGYLTFVGQQEPARTAFDGMFIRDSMAAILKLFALLCTVLMLIYARPYLVQRQLFKGEFYTIVMFAVIGVMLLVSSGSLITLYLGLELLTLSSYGLVALNRDALLSSEAALKYFVLGALSSGLLLYGMSLLYGATGTLDLHVLHSGVAHSSEAHLVMCAMIFILAGIAFKLGAAPFHMWVPDVYQGASTPVTMFIASTSKLAAFGMAYRLLGTGLDALWHSWQPLLLGMAVLSLAVGNLLAIVQTNLKRMLAYSTISHMGYLLIGLLIATPEAYAAAMFYAISYALMATAAFGVMLALSHAGFECEEIDDFKGLNQRAPWVAFLMLLVMFSLAGVPPMYGFFAKYLVLQAAVDAHMVWLAVVGAAFAIVGLYYYLRVVKVMYFDQTQSGQGQLLHMTSDMSVRSVLSINALVLLGLGVYWGPFFGWCRHAFS